MNLRHQNLCIRSALPEDAALLCAWWNDGRVMAHAGFPNGLNTNEQKVARSMGEDSDRPGRRLILEADGKPAGECLHSYFIIAAGPVFSDGTQAGTAAQIPGRMMRKRFPLLQGGQDGCLAG